MKIKATKNIIKEIEGTNTFEVLTFGKRQDLEELRDKLKTNGFNFNENGEPENACLRREKLIEYANGLKGEQKVERQLKVETILGDLQKYIELYFKCVDEKDLVLKYILDMNDIEIVIDNDCRGNSTGKAIINLKTNNDTDVLLSAKEV